mmetsp:Transcript_7474/g.12680  ORF Transcript_7474/g.12680 Transcript_7474/m.12680 type:complete len:137 (-) Transcript_7474:287-697(-)
MGQQYSKKIGFGYATDVGEGSEAGQAFAQATNRMHGIFRDCGEELRDVSDAVNIYGRNSEEFKKAAQRLELCQQRRSIQLSAIEALCGPSQAAFGACIQQASAGREHECLHTLHTFLDCAERALNDAQPICKSRST